jgi:hypothetical protein
MLLRHNFDCRRAGNLPDPAEKIALPERQPSPRTQVIRTVIGNWKTPAIRLFHHLGFSRRTHKREKDPSAVSASFA